MSDCGTCGARYHGRGCAYCAHGLVRCGCCGTEYATSPPGRHTVLETSELQSLISACKHDLANLARKARVLLDAASPHVPESLATDIGTFFINTQKYVDGSELSLANDRERLRSPKNSDERR